MSFEDKFKANLERGNAELEKRRQTLLEAERRERERRAQKEREEREMREREAQEAEERRRKEEERRLERQRELERQKEEEQQREIERKEVTVVFTRMNLCINVSSDYLHFSVLCGFNPGCTAGARAPEEGGVGEEAERRAQDKEGAGEG